MRRIIEHAGLEWEDGVRDFHKTERAVTTTAGGSPASVAARVGTTSSLSVPCGAYCSQYHRIAFVVL